MTFKREKTQLNVPFRHMRIAAISAVLVLIISCAGTAVLYNVGVRYVPTETAPKDIKETRSTVPVTVARFQDVRNVDDKIVIGRVYSADKKSLPVLPKYKKPSESIIKALEDFMTRDGFSVSVVHPDWNLQEDSIDESWGTILLGGTINDFFIECDRSEPVKKYRARVDLTLVLADIQSKQILYKVSVESSPSRDHIRFSEIMMERELNRALSQAIEQVFAGDAFLSKIEHISKKSR